MVLLWQKLTSKRIQKTKLIYIFVLWTAFFAVLSTSLLLFFFTPKPIFTTFSLFFVLVFFVLVFFFKTKLDTLNLRQKYLKLKESKAKPIKVNKDFLEKLPLNLDKHNFKLQSSTLDFNLYLKQNEPNRGLEIVFTLKNPDLDFLNPLLDTEIKKAVTKFGQKRISYLTCLVFKACEAHTKDAELKADNVVFLKNKGFNFTSINITYFQNEQTLYFLHSDKYFPSVYFKQASEFILTLTK